MEAIVNSDDVPGFRTVSPASVKAGDKVADVHGGTHLVSRVRVRKDGSVRIDRADGWFDVFLPGEVVTVPVGDDRDM